MVYRIQIGLAHKAPIFYPSFVNHCKLKSSAWEVSHTKKDTFKGDQEPPNDIPRKSTNWKRRRWNSKRKREASEKRFCSEFPDGTKVPSNHVKWGILHRSPIKHAIRVRSHYHHLGRLQKQRWRNKHLRKSWPISSLSASPDCSLLKWIFYSQLSNLLQVYFLLDIITSLVLNYCLNLFVKYLCFLFSVPHCLLVLNLVPMLGLTAPSLGKKNEYGLFISYSSCLQDLWLSPPQGRNSKKSRDGKSSDK